MAKAPAFQFYPKDWMDFKVQRLSLEAMGAYINLLCFMWKDSEDQCSMPDNDIFIARILSVSVRKWKKIRLEIQHDDAKLFLENDGKLFSQRLSEEAQKQSEYREKQSVAGKVGADKRWQAHGKPIATPMAKNSSSSSSSSSSSKKINNLVSQIADLRSLFPLDCQIFLDDYFVLLASENKTGKVTDGRKFSVLNQLYQVFTSSTSDKFKYAIEQSVKYQAPNVGYVKKVVKNSERKKQIQQSIKADEDKKAQEEARLRAQVELQRTKKMLLEQDEERRKAGWSI